MSNNFSMKELLKLRKRKAKPASSSTSLTAESYKQENDVLELVEGDTVLKRLKKYAHIKSMEKMPQVEANKIPGVVGGKSIAVCLVIVDKLHHEGIWRRWMEQCNECNYKASLHIHAKFPEKISSPWVRKHTLSHSFLPEWNSPEVIRAVLAVIKDALGNGDTGRLVLGTESCIPIRTLQEIGDKLFAEEVSWLPAYHKAKHAFEEHKCFWAVDKNIIPQEYVWKSLPGWVMLTRKHAEAIISLPEKVNCPDFVVAWNTVFAPEEVYFPTMLALLGFLRDPSRGDDEVKRQCSTFSEWKKQSDANPITYDALTGPLLSYLQETGALFARKFRADTVSADHWDNLIRQAAGTKSDSVDSSSIGTNIMTSVTKSESVEEYKCERNVEEYKCEEGTSTKSQSKGDDKVVNEIMGPSGEPANKRAKSSEDSW